MVSVPIAQHRARQAMRLYGCLRKHVDDTGSWAGDKGQLAALARMTRRDVQKAVNDLVAAGSIEIVLAAAKGTVIRVR